MFITVPIKRLRRMLESSLSASEVSTAPYTQVLAEYHRFLRRLTQGLLVVAAVFGILRGIGYSPFLAPEKLPLAVSITSEWVPLTVWATLWFFSGLACIFGAWVVKPAATLGIVIMSFIWAVGYTASWLYGYSQPIGDPSRVATYRDWLSASIYWTVCLAFFGGRYLALACLRLTRVVPPAPAPAEEFPPIPVLKNTKTGDEHGE